MKVLRPDFCVVGAGSGGLSFAAGATQMGAHVVLVEKGKMGGDCLNTGCIPSKSLIEAAKMSHLSQVSKRFGCSFSQRNVDFKKVSKHIHSVISSIAPHDSVERFMSLGVQVIGEKGFFLDEKTLQAGKERICAKRFIISTGSRPFVPPIPGLSDVPYLTNESVFQLKECPQSLIIIGGGPIGIELAQAFQRLGCQVTVLEIGRILPKDDPDAVNMLRDVLLGEGVNLKEQAQVQKISQLNKKIKVSYIQDGRKREVSCSHILVAAGRRPNIQKLELERAAVDFTPHGISVNKRLQTSNKRIYALGDCIGGYQFTHVAGYHAGLALRNAIFRLRAPVETRSIPWVTYADPELSHVGKSEDELKRARVPYKLVKMPFSENDRAQTAHKTTGFIKVTFSPKGNVYGATILGPHAGELIYPWVIAIQNNLKASALTNSIAPYPTYSDLVKRCAGEFYKDRIFSQRMRQIVRILMHFWR